MVETLEAPTRASVHDVYGDEVMPQVATAETSGVEHILIDNFRKADTTRAQELASFARRNNEIYYRGQARQFGFWLPLDPSRINGVAYPVRDLPKREDYQSTEDYERARSDFADALSSQEKHALSGVPFN